MSPNSEFPLRDWIESELSSITSAEILCVKNEMLTKGVDTDTESVLGTTTEEQIKLFCLVTKYTLQERLEEPHLSLATTEEGRAKILKALCLICRKKDTCEAMLWLSVWLTFPVTNPCLGIRKNFVLIEQKIG